MSTIHATEVYNGTLETLDDGSSGSTRTVRRDPATFAAWQRWWYDNWLSETFHLLLGVSCLAAIAALLASYNDATLPLNLPLGLTLSAFVSTLAAVAKYALAVPLDECLGAQKWLVRKIIVATIQADNA